jgi:uncharacterized protein (DUF2236 family)
MPVVFAEVQRVREFLNTYCGGPDKIPVSLDDITVAIAKIYGVEITTQLVPFGSFLLKGMIEIYATAATIMIDAALNTADTRYVYVKEVSHVMLLNAKNATKDPAEVIDYYVHARPDDASHPAEIVCEEVTKFAAVELLFPPALREYFTNEIANHRATLFTVGEALHMPENLVEFVLSNWYMDLSEKLRDSHPDRERFAPTARKSRK